MLLLPFWLFFPSLLKLTIAMQGSSLYRSSTGHVCFGNFRRDAFRYLRAEKLTSIMVENELECIFLCVEETKCYSLNLAAYPDSKGLHLCELLATDKYKATKHFLANDTFHHHSPASPCESAPCKNSASCVTEYVLNSYRCDCEPGFCGTHCEREGRTCSDIKYCNPMAKSGSYVIDPDGEGGVKPFKVYCDMTDKEGFGVTVVSHDSENMTLVDGFDSHGSYSRDVTYHDTSLLQLAILTASSSHCEQFIKYGCYHSALLYNGDMRGWWVSRDGENMTYWGGADSVPFKCACGLNNTCANKNFGCNCDTNDWNWREDSGLITDKSKLPVTQLRFGDTGVIGSKNEKGNHTLGKLRCYGLI